MEVILLFGALTDVVLLTNRVGLLTEFECHNW